MFAYHLTPNRVVRAAVLLVVGVCLSPDRAAAQCGNHTPLLKHPLIAAEDAAPETATSSDLVPCHGAQCQNRAAFSVPQPPSPAKPPCHGPNCQSNPTPKAPAPAAPTVVSHPTDAVLGFAAKAPRDSRAAFARDHDSVSSIHRSSSIYHPPRHV